MATHSSMLDIKMVANPSTRSNSLGTCMLGKEEKEEKEEETSQEQGKHNKRV